MIPFAPGPGPKPAGPTHPKPSAPRPRDTAIPAGPLLAEADALAVPPMPLDLVADMAETLLTRALRLVDGQPDAPSPAQFDLSVAGFHIERALAAIGHLTPARQSDQSSAAVGLNAIATPGGPGPTPLWHEFLFPREVRLAGPQSPPKPQPPPRPGQPGGPRP